MERNKYNCPICYAELTRNYRYPNYICAQCSEKATDIEGKRLIFRNRDLSGGFVAIYKDSQEIYNSNICYINKIICYADEARFGGIVIEKK